MAQAMKVRMVMGLDVLWVDLLRLTEPRGPQPPAAKARFGLGTKDDMKDIRYPSLLIPGS